MKRAPKPYSLFSIMSLVFAVLNNKNLKSKIKIKIVRNEKLIFASRQGL